MSRASELYQEVFDLENNVKLRKRELEEKLNVLESKTRRYRIESVHRVLDFIRSEYRQGRVCDLEVLLCHCQNKLNGNIDGVELFLDESHKGINAEEFQLKCKNKQEGGC